MTPTGRLALLFALAAVASPVTLPTAATQLQAQQAALPAGTRTIAQINRSPTGHPPRDGSWSPDGKRFTFLAADAQFGQPGDIIQIDAATGKSSVLATAAQLSALSSDAVNEKDKDHRARYKMSSYLWADDSKHLLLDNGGKLWLYSIADHTGSLVVDTGAGSGDDPKFSPDAKSVSYLRDHNLYVHPVAASAAKETALTSTTASTLLNGEVDWVYLEELNVRSNYFWSPDSAHLAYLQADEAKVPEYPITDWIPTHATIDQQRYPQPGDPNPVVRVGVVAAKGGATRFIELPFSVGNDYIPRFGWVDSSTLYIEVLTRDHQHLNLYFADAHTGKSRLVYADTDPKFLNDKYDITFLPKGQFLATSWRDGHTHIYLYRFDESNPIAADATLVRQLTQGDYEVEDLQGFDPATQTVFYTSSEGSPLESNLWSVRLDGSAHRRLTPAPGVHDVQLSPDSTHFSDQASTFTTPPVVSLCSVAATESCNAFWHSAPIAPATGVAVDHLTLLAADGTTKLYGTLTRPSTGSAASTPIILNPYGGPLPAPGIRNAWGSGNLFNELMAQHGFAVLTVDNRGSGGRGRDFEQFNYHNFGPVQFADQIASLDQVLKQFSVLDPQRVGWWGWSWGGSFTLYAMTHTDRIKAGVAVAPVTDWRNYDSIYTERYLGLPAQNPGSYIDQSPVTSAEKLKGHLLIAHGTGDDNVHFANTIQFIQPLIAHGIPYDLQLFPRKTHSIAGNDARDELFNRILAHFETNLK